MTQVDIIEAIAGVLARLWPDRMVYRDFCPVDHKRPSTFLYCTTAEYNFAFLGGVEWTVEAEAQLFSAVDHYDVESTEQLRQDQAAVLAQFGRPIQINDRHILILAKAQAPGPGVAVVTFSASWMDTAPGFERGEEAPLMEHYTLLIDKEEINGSD